MTYFRPLIPPVIWAQRNSVVFVTICVEDCKNPDIKIEPEQIIFHSIAGLSQKVYEITIPLFATVDPEVNITQLFLFNTKDIVIVMLLINIGLFYLFSILKNSKTTVGGRYVELILQKLPSDTKYWPHLTKEKKKYHWLKVDFKKWKDEDDSDDEAVSGVAGMGGDANIDDVCKVWHG